MEEPRTGETLGRYRVVRKLGEGGMGAVFLAEDSRLGRLVALKILSSETAADPARVGRFKREARVAAALQHPNVVTIHDVGEDAGRHYIAMEYLDGTPLDRLFGRGSLAVGRCLDFGVQLADALTAAHEAGITHRDLKPTNVIVGAEDRLKLLDFGLAKESGAAERRGAAESGLSSTASGTLLGTFPYMSPEQACGESIDHRSDIYSLGVVLYEALCGQRPFGGETPAAVLAAVLRDEPRPLAELRPELPAGLVRLVHRCLHKRPGRRYPDASAVRDELARLARAPATAERDLSREKTLATLGPPVAASPRPLAEIWNVPHRRNPNFVGREKELAEVRRHLTTSEMVAVIGLGGVGKTQFAVEYAYRFAGEYSLVWWVQATDAAALKSGLAALGRELELPRHKELDETVAQVSRWLTRNAGWLLVLDEAADPDALEPFLPPAGRGHVLATSRNPSWRRLARPVELVVWGPHEAEHFLRQRSGCDEPEAATELADGLGYLPLALEQAAAFVETRGMRLASYLELFREHRLALLAEGSDRSNSSVLVTWELSFARVKAVSELAIRLLYLFSVLAPDDIPLDLLRARGGESPAPLEPGWDDELEFERALSVLRRYSLVRRASGSVSVHRLVQSVVRRDLGAETTAWAAAAVELLARRFPPEAHWQLDVWPLCARLLPHAQACLARSGEAAGDAVAELSDRVGTYLLGRAEYDEARGHLERALRVDQQAHGADHPRVAERLNSLGRLLHVVGDLHAARASLGRALEISEAAFPQDDPRLARVLTNLGINLLHLGQPEAAREPLERAVAISLAADGEDRAKVAARINNLGNMHAELGDFAAAKKKFEIALKLWEEAYGPDHPHLAQAINNISGVLVGLGEFEAAEQGYRRAIAIAEAAYGHDHPTLGLFLVNLGEQLHRRGDLEGARSRLERGLAIQLDAYGAEHPAVATALLQLGSLSLSQEEPAAARGHFERALRIRECVFGPDHDLTREVADKLALLDA